VGCGSGSAADRLVAAARTALPAPEAVVARQVLADDLGLLAELDVQIAARIRPFTRYPTEQSVASGQSSTLIALGLKRRDAEDLAGEFPVKPREEWTETIWETDGTDPKRLPSPTQAEDLYLTGHTDPLVDLAARSLFRAALREGAKSYRVPPRPGGEGRRGVQIPASDVNDLLYKAANGELNSSEALVDFLTEALGDFVKFSFGWMYASLGRFNPGRSAEVHGFVYYGFHMESPDIIPYIKCLCYLIRQNAPLEDRRRGLSPEYGRKRCPAEHDPEKLEAEADYNTRVRDQFYAACREYRLGPLRKWLLVYVQDRRALCNSVYTEAFRQADQALQKAAMAGSWWKLFKWRGGLDERGWRYASLSGTANSWYTHYVETTAAISLLRDRLRWLLVLCDGVSRDPILVTSGEQEPRRRPHHIVHSRQNQQDALDES
jgi:hypothetical protein